MCIVIKFMQNTWNTKEKKFSPVTISKKQQLKAQRKNSKLMKIEIGVIIRL